ncbi:MAG: VOC family protein [Pseudomonadota bacterium]
MGKFCQHDVPQKQSNLDQVENATGSVDNDSFKKEIPAMDTPSILSHLSVPVKNAEKAVAFYDAVMPTIGAKRTFEGHGAVAYGKMFPEFWVHPPYEGEPTTGNGWHVAFMADSKDAVHAFYSAATTAGGSCNGAPGPRPDYGPQYYGAFMRDLDGNKIEVCYWDETASA